MKRNRIFKWLVRNLIAPKRENFENPGFLVEKIDMTEDREILIPETLLIDIENEIDDKDALYRTGKAFGYTYLSISNFPTIKKRGIKAFVYFLFNAIEALCAESIQYSVDWQTKKISLWLKNFIICSKNGEGQLFTTGGCAGLWAWILCDKSVEGVQPECQGRKADKCMVICAPKKVLSLEGYKAQSCQEFEIPEIDENYWVFNKIRPAKWATKSLKSFIDDGVFNYSDGKITYKGERFIICESVFMYILERDLKKKEKDIRILWKASFGFGKKLAKSNAGQDANKFITDFLSACGFGDALVVKKGGKYSIILDYIPWLCWAKDIDFVLVRGVVSGMLSGFSGKDIILAKIEKDTSKNYLSLNLSQR